MTRPTIRPTKPPPTSASKLWPSQNPSVAPMSIEMIGIVSGLPALADLSFLAAQRQHAGFQRFRRDIRRCDGWCDHERDPREHSTPAPHPLAVSRARKEASPQTAQRHRDHRNRRRRDHLLDARTKPIELAGRGQLPFGEDADDLALF